MKEILPLFNSLFQESENNQNLTENEMKEMTESIKILDREGHEILFALIRHYQLKIDQQPIEKEPYDFKSIKSGYKFTIHKLPSKLQIMLKNFVDLHSKKLQEEKQRNKFFEST
jgi:hypothetical protein